MAASRRSKVPPVGEAEPEVGRFYRVPCVLARCWKRREPAWMPVLGPRHADPELNTPGNHWHFDWRFISLDHLRRYHGRRQEEADIPAWMGQLVSTPEDGPRELIRRCVRRMPRFPADRIRSGKIRRLWQGLEATYATHRLRPGCAVCPHRGFRLDNLPPDAEGVVTCPGHGLRWNLATGELVPRDWEELRQLLELPEAVLL